MRNVFLTGASGTGKTTVAKLLSEKLNLVHPPSVSRSCPHPISTNQAQTWIGAKTFEQAMSIEGSVMDRTPMDCSGYNSAFGLHNQQADDNRVKLFAATNPFVVYFPIYWPAEDDGFRPVSPSLNRIVDNYIVYLLKINDIKYMTVQNEPATDRTELIISEWENYNGNGNQTKK